MKRLAAVCLLVLMIMGISACSLKKEYEHPVSCYYLRAASGSGEIQHGSQDSVIGAETREGAGYVDNWNHLLRVYLQGPGDGGFRSPYPVGTVPRFLTVDGDHASVVLSYHFADLRGIDLTLACTCLSLTVMDLTGVDAVTISVSGFTLDGKESITIDRENLILTDAATPIP